MILPKPFYLIGGFFWIDEWLPVEGKPWLQIADTFYITTA